MAKNVGNYSRVSGPGRGAPTYGVHAEWWKPWGKTKAVEPEAPVVSSEPFVLTSDSNTFASYRGSSFVSIVGDKVILEAHPSSVDTYAVLPIPNYSLEDWNNTDYYFAPTLDWGVPDELGDTPYEIWSSGIYYDLLLPESLGGNSFEMITGVSSTKQGLLDTNASYAASDIEVVNFNFCHFLKFSAFPDAPSWPNREYDIPEPIVLDHSADAPGQGGGGSQAA